MPIDKNKINWPIGSVEEAMDNIGETISDFDDYGDEKDFKTADLGMKEALIQVLVEIRDELRIMNERSNDNGTT